MMVRERHAVRLDALLPFLPVREVFGERSVEIIDVTGDSRQVREGSLFVALRGFHEDGHRFLREARKRGAAAALVERPDRDLALSQVVVTDARLAVGIAAAEVHGNPSRAMSVHAVTGTNGKTTVVHLFRSILEGAGRPCGTLGTLGGSWPGGEAAPFHTTPGPDVIHRLLGRMRRDGVASVGLEASSHGIALRRLVGLHLRTVALTNVTRDHIDFHGTVEAYRREKMRLFLPVEMETDRVTVEQAVIDIDDETGARLAGTTPLPAITCGRSASAALRAEAIQCDMYGSHMKLLWRGSEVEADLPLPGEFNVSNALVAVGLALTEGLSLDEVVFGLAEATPPAGRMERVERGQPFAVVIDYAHTPDGLRHLLGAVRETTTGDVILLFGCGGERDRGKRPVMGEIAAELADRILLTDDNPRGEDPAEIRRAVEAGLRRGPARFEIVPDRAEAMERAFRSAGAGDTVILAGKGHERCQIFGGERRPWNERAVAESLLDRLGGGAP